MREDIYNEIIRFGEETYSWLGKQIFEEFALSIASWKLQFILPSWRGRVRRHLLLYWPTGQFKSRMLRDLRDMIGRERARFLTTSTEAAFRGTVYDNVFVPPELKISDFIMVLDMNALLGKRGREELYGMLLTALEEGVVRVSVSKSIARFISMAEAERESLLDEYGMSVDDKGRLEYDVHAVFIMATHRLICGLDEAFHERFVVAAPNGEVDRELIEYVMLNEPPFPPSMFVNQINRLLDGRDPLNVDLPAFKARCMEVLREFPYMPLDGRIPNNVMISLLCRIWWHDDMDVHREDWEWLRGRIGRWMRGYRIVFPADSVVYDVLSRAGRRGVEEGNVELCFLSMADLVRESGLSERRIAEGMEALRPIIVKTIIGNTWKYALRSYVDMCGPLRRPSQTGGGMGGRQGAGTGGSAGEGAGQASDRPAAAGPERV